MSQDSLFGSHCLPLDGERAENLTQASRTKLCPPTQVLPASVVLVSGGRGTVAFCLPFGYCFWETCGVGIVVIWSDENSGK